MAKRLIEWVLLLVNKIIPLRCLVIESKCPLRDDCDYKIHVLVLSGKNKYSFEDLLGMHFSAVAEHLKEKHKVNFFVGLEYKTDNHKYQIYGRPPVK
jgi:hypothetical protein